MEQHLSSIDDRNAGCRKSVCRRWSCKLYKTVCGEKDDWNKAASVSDGTANQVRYMRYANPNPMTGKDGKTLVENFEAVQKEALKYG